MYRSLRNRPRFTQTLTALSGRARLFLAGSLALGTMAILLPSLLLPGVSYQAPLSSAAGALSPSQQLGVGVPTPYGHTTPTGAATSTESPSGGPASTTASAGPVSPAGSTTQAADAPTSAATTAPVTTSYAASPSTVYMHYYMWWSPQH